MLTTLKLNKFPKKFKKFIRNKDLITNIYIKQAYDWTMCG